MVTIEAHSSTQIKFVLSKQFFAGGILGKFSLLSCALSIPLCTTDAMHMYN